MTAVAFATAVCALFRYWNGVHEDGTEALEHGCDLRTGRHTSRVKRCAGSAVNNLCTDRPLERLRHTLRYLKNIGETENIC